MTNRVKVRIEWTETLDHTSDIFVDLDEVVRWLNEDRLPSARRLVVDDVTADHVREFLKSGNEQEDWVDPAHAGLIADHDNQTQLNRVRDMFIRTGGTR